jgi:L-ascorbate metabolism protein UlaG (beta-lactamase superfamily)
MQLILALCAATPAMAGEPFETDTIRTSAGDLEITFIGHGTLMMAFGGKIIHIDPFGRLADYGKLPDADYIFITHHHGDHLDPGALEKIRTEKTVVVLTAKCAEKVPGDIIMANGDVDTVGGITIEAVPAYNLVHRRDSGEPYHIKGEGNGYVMTFGNTRIYIAGDTENTPEMKALGEIDIAFLPMNVPYTMTPEMVADAVEAFKPRVLYPYHYGDTDTSILLELLEGNEETEVRIRSMR